MLEAGNSRTFRVIFLSLITAAICLFFMQQEVFAVEIVDQSNLPEWAGGWTHINPDPNGQARMWQTFTPEQSNITAVKIDIMTASPGRGDDTLTVEIAKDGEILASVGRYVEDGFEGLLRLEFDEPVAVVPGELYELKVHGTGLTRFGWRYASNTYDAGSRYVSASEHPGTDWFFRTYATVEPKIIYVDDDAAGANDGTSWENAYVYLQDALADANDANKPVEIRVAQGIYKPDLGGGNVPGDMEAAFKLINGVTLAGGYAGIDTNDPNARDIELYETILTGDLNGNDVEVNVEDLWNEHTRAENSYHVLIGSETDITAVLDGFIVTGGAANGPELDDDPIDNDRLRCGGGMYSYDASPTLTNCTFSGNCGWTDGGMANRGCAKITLTNCTFSGNIGGHVGGIFNMGGSSILTNCMFSDNSGWTAGGIYNYKSSSTLTNCTFSGNSDGGMTNSGSSVTLNNCTFSGNFPGMNNSYADSVIMTNCIFSGNYLDAIRYYSNWDDPNDGIVSILTNCTFSGNYRGVISWDDPNRGPGPILTNCIIWYNTPNEIPEFSTITYSNIQDGWDGQGNISEDPIFANPGYWADVNDPNIVVEPDLLNAIWINGDYHLKSQAGRWDPDSQSWVVDEVTSPGVDAGDPNMPVGDEPFPSGIRINMGAYGGTTEASKSISNVPEVVNVNDSDNGSQVTLRQGQILAVTLESNPTTGYSWAPVEKQNSIFEPFGDPIYFPPEEVDGVVGAGGWEIFYFRSVSAGQETLQLVYRRSWETDVEPIKTFSIDVVVN